jgi:pyrroline-5-carboxylate reductase
MLDSIAFIGAGVMAEAMIGGLLDKELVAPDHITATGPREKRRAELETRYPIRTTADNRAAA